VTAPVVRELLASHAGARQRVADDYMFTVTRDGYRVGTFRLQLFTAPGTRPVAVATQTAGRGRVPDQPRRWPTAPLMTDGRPAPLAS
jgi:hypothetical protein